MKTIKDHVSLRGEFETITMTELRMFPGQVLKSVELGKVFVVTHQGNPIAVLSPLPGVNLTIVVGSKGQTGYSL